MFFPMAARTGLPRSKSSARPPTMEVSVPASAPPVPPETGASSMGFPFSAAATSRAVWGAMVLESTAMTPGRRFSRTPPAER